MSAEIGLIPAKLAKLTASNFEKLAKTLEIMIYGSVPYKYIKQALRNTCNYKKNRHFKTSVLTLVYLLNMEPVKSC